MGKDKSDDRLDDYNDQPMSYAPCGEEHQQTLNTYTQNENDLSTNQSRIHYEMRRIEDSPVQEVIPEFPSYDKDEEAERDSVQFLDNVDQNHNSEEHLVTKILDTEKAIIEDKTLKYTPISVPLDTQEDIVPAK